MIKRISDNFTTGAAAAGLLLGALAVVAALGDQVRLAVVGLALLQVLILSAVLVLIRRSSSTAPDEQADNAAELARAISNVGLRAVDEIRSSERELGARLDALHQALESPENHERPV